MILADVTEVALIKAKRRKRIHVADLKDLE